MPLVKAGDMPPSQSMNFASSRFVGVVLAVKARIRLCRSFDQISHQYQGYTLVMRGTVDDEDHDEFRIAVGPAAHKKNEFRIGDRLSGKTHLVADPRTEWAEFNRTSGLKFLDRGPDEHNRPADADGGIAPPVEVYRAGAMSASPSVPVRQSAIGVHSVSRWPRRSSLTNGIATRRSGDSRPTATALATALATSPGLRAAFWVASPVWSGSTMTSSARSEPRRIQAVESVDYVGVSPVQSTPMIIPVVSRSTGIDHRESKDCETAVRNVAFL